MNRLTREILNGGPVLISVLSGKGGVGKSVLAFNFAERMASRGNRVLLVDGDLTGGSLPVLANVDADSGLERYLAHSSPLVDAVVNVRDHLDLLGRSTIEPLPDMARLDQQADFVRRLRIEAAGYERIVIDQSSGVTDFATIVAGASDINLLVLVPELTSISDCYGLFKHLRNVCPDVDCHLLLNRTESDEESDDVFSRFAAMTEQFLGASPTLAGALPEEPLVKRAVALQRALVEVDPEVSILQRLSLVDERLFGTVAPDTISRINNLTALADIRE